MVFVVLKESFQLQLSLLSGLEVAMRVGYEGGSEKTFVSAANECVHRSCIG